MRSGSVSKCRSPSASRFPICGSTERSRSTTDQKNRCERFQVDDLSVRDHPAQVADRERFRLDILVFIRLCVIALTGLAESRGFVEDHFFVAVAGRREEAA